MENNQALFIKMVVDAWQTQNKRVDDLLTKLSDDQLLTDVAHGRNSGVYLLGHLTAVNDALLPLLGFGEKLYPQLEEIFLKNGDKKGFQFPSLAELKEQWNTVNTKLNQHIAALPDSEWFTKHSSVSAEDFAKEPHRNKLNVLIGRTNHQSYHLGQLAFLKN